MIRYLLCSFLLWSSAAAANQSLIDRLHEAEERHSLPHNSLVALSETESSLNLFAINVDDGASFYPKSKTEALRILRNISNRPFILKVKERESDSNSEVYFFKTERAANQALARITQPNSKFQPVRHPDNSYVRKLNMLNTGLCALQLNYRWQAHGQGRGVNTLLDPDFCINHGAKFLSGLIRQHGFKKGVGCYYTCGKSERAQRDRREYIARYNRHFNRLRNSATVAQR